jgi:HrpA-like RNA helicase
MIDPNDYLDAKAKGVNFLTGQPWSAEYRALAAKWSAYPMYSQNVTRELLDAYDKSRVVLVTAGTGSGKTVIAPKILLRYLLDQKKDSDWKIGVTNPKTVTTFANAEFAAKCLDVPLGTQVGYAYRGAPAGSAGPDTRLVYMTDGYLLAQTRADPTLDSTHKYAAIVLDEAHERPVPVDMLLLRARKILQARDDFKVVIMSATIDARTFVDYFQKAGIPVRLVEADGAPRHRVESRWLPQMPPPDGYMAKAVEAVSDVLKKSPKGGDILVFVPTIGDTRKGCEKVSKMPGALEKIACHALHSKITEAERAAATAPPKAGAPRKVIFATNIAESSITLDGIEFVVDTGLQITSRWDPEADATVVKKDFTTQSQIKQREGRVGRTAPGTCLHLYTQAHFEALQLYPDPVIRTIDFTDYLLQMLSEEEFDDDDEDLDSDSRSKMFPDLAFKSRPKQNGAYPDVQVAIATCRELLTPPTPYQVASALSYLHRNCLLEVRPPGVDYGQLKSYEAMAMLSGNVTTLGRVVNAMHRLKLSIPNTLLVLAGLFYNVVTDCVIFACIAEVAQSESGWSSLWRQNVDRTALRDALKPFAVPKSDHATLVNLYKNLRSSSTSKGIGQLLDLDVWNKIVDKVEYVRRGMFDRVKSADAVRQACPFFDLKNDELDPFEKCLLSARLYNLCGADMVRESGKKNSKKALPKIRVRNYMPIQRRTCTIDGSAFSRAKEAIEAVLQKRKVAYGVYENITSLDRTGFQMEIITVFQADLGVV